MPQPRMWRLRAALRPAAATQDLPEHGVTVVFVKLPNTKIELLQPFGDASPIAGFLKKNPAGGIHHVCLEVGSTRPTLAVGRPAARAPPASHDRPAANARPPRAHAGR